MSGGHLLVVAHEATRTGAPRVLADALRLLRDDLDATVEVRLDVGGPLEVALRSIEDGAVAEPTAVLVNSALAADLVRRHPGLPAAIYVHEDRHGIAVLAPSAVEAITTRFDLVLCVSERSRDELVELGVAPDRIRVVPPLVPVVDAPSADDVEALRTRLGLSPTESLVLGCGEASWRKGADLFVAACRDLADRRDGWRAAWVGQRPRSFARQLDHDLEQLGLGERVRFVDEVADPRPALAAADVLVLPSRSDPQPLVPIEAAQLGVPTVGFAVGGLVDLADQDAAVVAAYPDVPALAGSIADLLDDPGRRAATAERARSRWERRQSPAALRTALRAVAADLGLPLRTVVPT